MRLKRNSSTHALAMWLCLLAPLLASCFPIGAPSATAPSSSQSPEATKAVTGCSAGGRGVFSPEDVRCYLVNVDPAQVQVIDDETTILLADSQTITDWAGAAIIFHMPTLSTLVLDWIGDVNPQASVFSSRAGLAALSELTGDPGLTASLKQEVQRRWQTSPSNEPEIRLSTAWQDGPTTIFLIAVAGLAAEDDRFYCPSQAWTIGDSTIEIVPDCVAHDAGAPVSHFFFMSQQIKGDSEQAVQVALDGVPSNVVRVREGTLTQETIVYKAVLQHLTNRPLIVRGETAPGFDGDADRLATQVDPTLMQNYLAANKLPYSLRFLFENSNAYFVQPGEVIARDYLSTGELQQSCQQFRSEYPGLGGVVTLSRIGYSDDGAQALVHMLLECGTADRHAAYLPLTRSGETWQVTEEIAVALPTLLPEMDYVNHADGCGDIFVYKSNRDRSEYVTVSIDAKAFDLSTTPVTLDLTVYPEAIGALIDVYVDSVDQLGEKPYCNDVSQTAYPQSVWRAVSGTVTVSVSASLQTEPCAGEPYQAVVLIEDVVFTLGEETVRLPSLMFDDVTVGWCPG
jgi:hypothetical protein